MTILCTQKYKSLSGQARIKKYAGGCCLAMHDLVHPLHSIISTLEGSLKVLLAKAWAFVAWATADYSSSTYLWISTAPADRNLRMRAITILRKSSTGRRRSPQHLAEATEDPASRKLCALLRTLRAVSSAAIQAFRTLLRSGKVRVNIAE